MGCGSGSCNPRFEPRLSFSFPPPASRRRCPVRRVGMWLDWFRAVPHGVNTPWRPAAWLRSLLSSRR